MSAEVVMYRTPFCPYCVRAADLFARKGVAIREVDVSDDPARRRWLQDVTRSRTVPQIFINGRPVGGCDEVTALDRRGQLDALLAEPPGSPSGHL